MNRQPILYRIPGEVLCFLTMFIFGAYGPTIKTYGPTEKTPGIPIMGFLFAFQIVGALGFFLLLLRNGAQKISKRGWMLIGLLVLAATGNDLGYFFALRLTTVTNAAVAHHLESIFMLFLAPLFVGEKTKRNEWISLAITLLGIGFLYYDSINLGQKDILGVTLALMSAVFLAGLIVLYRLLQNENLSVVTINFWRHFLNTLILLPVLFFMDLSPYTSPKNLLALFIFGFIFAVIASGIHNFAIGRTRSIRVALIGKTEPIIASLYAFLFLNETPHLNAILGGVLIIGATVWLIVQKEAVSTKAN